jgi:predicted AAA+ superfamily ATPase
MLKSEILSVVKDQKNGLKNINLGISREHIKEIKLNDSFAYVISGIRRCGKSTLLHQIRVNQKDYAYFNFEDTRLNNFRVEDFEKLKECLLEIYGKTNTFFFDEIQNIKKWELFIRQLLDNKAKILITGSNASLLSKELGTRLTGRNLRKVLFPFSYKEYLKFKSQKQNFNSFEEYLVNGGFPDYLKYKNEEILQELLNNTLYRDIVVRHRLKESKTLKDLTLYLLSNIGKEYSYNSLKKLLILVLLIL